MQVKLSLKGADLSSQTELNDHQQYYSKSAIFLASNLMALVIKNNNYQSEWQYTKFYLNTIKCLISIVKQLIS